MICSFCFLISYGFRGADPERTCLGRVSVATFPFFFIFSKKGRPQMQSPSNHKDTNIWLKEEIFVL